jgi:glucose/arabinose dehydrogenase
MMRGIILLMLVSASQMFGDVQNLPALPAETSANAIQVDAAGNIYVAGRYPQNPNAPANVFAAKLSPDGSQVIWQTTFGRLADDRATALALGPDGSVYLTGNTASSDFPTTPVPAGIAVNVDGSVILAGSARGADYPT